MKAEDRRRRDLAKALREDLGVRGEVAQAVREELRELVMFAEPRPALPRHELDELALLGAALRGGRASAALPPAAFTDRERSLAWEILCNPVVRDVRDRIDLCEVVSRVLEETHGVPPGAWGRLDTIAEWAPLPDPEAALRVLRAWRRRVQVQSLEALALALRQGERPAPELVAAAGVVVGELEQC